MNLTYSTCADFDFAGLAISHSKSGLAILTRRAAVARASNASNGAEQLPLLMSSPDDSTDAQMLHDQRMMLASAHPAAGRCTPRILPTINSTAAGILRDVARLSMPTHFE